MPICPPTCLFAPTERANRHIDTTHFVQKCVSLLTAASVQALTTSSSLILIPHILIKRSNTKSKGYNPESPGGFYSIGSRGYHRRLKWPLGKFRCSLRLQRWYKINTHSLKEDYELYVCARVRVARTCVCVSCSLHTDRQVQVISTEV